jgi:hypothetical protein
MSSKNRKNKEPKIFSCPCCDFIVFKNRGAQEICPVCYWEDDGADIDMPGAVSVSNNMLTLTQARENFDSISACDKQWTSKVCSAAERATFDRVPRRTEARVFRLIEALEKLGIGVSRQAIGFFYEGDIEEAEEVYSKAIDKRGVVVCGFGANGFNSFVDLKTFWVANRSDVADEFQELIVQTGKSVGLRLTKSQEREASQVKHIGWQTYFHVADASTGHRLI